MGPTDLWTKHVRNVNNSFPWVIGIGVVKVYRITFDVLYPIDSSLTLKNSLVVTLSYGYFSAP